MVTFIALSLYVLGCVMSGIYAMEVASFDDEGVTWKDILFILSWPFIIVFCILAVGFDLLKDWLIKSDSNDWGGPT